MLLAEGRLDRASRVLATCGRDGWASSMRVLSELGRDAEAKVVAAKIDAATDATDDERAAVAELRAKVVTPVDGRALLAAGLDKKRAGDIVAARRLFDRAAVALGGVRTVDTRNGLSGAARAARFGPDGTLVVAHGALLSVFTSLRESRVLRGHEGNVVAIAISPDGKRLASAADDRTVRLWALPSGAPLKKLVLTADVTSVALRDDLLAVGLGDRTVRVLRDGELVRALSHHGGAVTAVAFSPDGTLASASIDRTVRLVEPVTGDAVRVITTATTPLSLAFSPNGKLLAIGGADPSIRVLDASTGWPVASLAGHAEQVLDVAFSRDGGSLASASADETVRLWDVGAAFVCKKTLEGHVGTVSAVAFDPTGAHLASASDDRTVELWDAKSGAAVATVGSHADGATSVSIARDGAIAWGSRDGAVRIVRDGHWATVRGHVTSVLAVAWSPDGRTLASGGDDDTVRLVRDEVSTKIGSHKGSVTSVAWSNDVLVSAARDGTIRTWPSSAKGTLRRHGKAVESLATMGDVTLSGSVDGTIRVFHGDTSTTIRHFFSPILALSFHDASSFASGSLDGSIAVFSLDGTRRTVLEGHADGVTGLAWSRDLLASTSLDGSALLWSTLEGGAPWPLEHDDDDEVTGVAFAHDGAWLATTSGDGGVRLFRRDGRSVVLLRGLRDGGGYVVTPSGHYESFGEQPPLRCAIGADLFPIDLCEERFAVSGLLRKALDGDVSYELP